MSLNINHVTEAKLSDVVLFFYLQLTLNLLVPTTVGARINP